MQAPTPDSNARGASTRVRRAPPVTDIDRERLTMLLGDLDLEEHFATIEDADLEDTHIESEEDDEAYGNSSAEAELYAIAVDAERTRSDSQERADEIYAASELEMEEARHARLDEEEEYRLDESYLSETTGYLCDSFVTNAT